MLKTDCLLPALTLVLCLLLPSSSFGGHIVGGEVAYACQGWKDGDPSTGIKVYDIRINMYRDNIGQGAYFDGVVPGGRGEGPQGNTSIRGTYTIYRGQQLFEETLDLVLGPVAPVDLNLGNPCLVLTEPADQQIGVYEFTIELPVSDQPYTITYQRCCRNTAIRNLNNPGEIGSTYFIDITPEAQQRCNASPRFNIDPPIAICVNEPFVLDLGATDREGDSLAYKLCNPVVGGGDDGVDGGPTTATFFDDVAPLIESPPPYADADWFSNNFNVVNQLGRASELAVSDTSGIMSGRPTIRGTFALAVCVEEWALDSVSGNRFLISETKREFQLIVNLCGTRVNADLEETSIDDMGRFYIKWCGFGEQLIVNESTEIDAINTYNWRLNGPDGLITGEGRDLQTNIDVEGLYEGVMVLNQNSVSQSCIDSAAFLIEVFPGINPDFETTESLCEDIPIDFTNLTTTEGTNRVTNITWDLGNNDSTSFNQSNFSYLYPQPGRYDVELSAVDDNECEASIVKQVLHFPRANTILVPGDESFGCAPYERFFENNSRPLSDEYIFEWEFGDGGLSGDREPTHLYEELGIFDVYLKITSPIGCEVDTVLLEFIDVRESPRAGFRWQPDKLSNFEPEFTIIDEAERTFGWRYAITDRESRPLFRIFEPTFSYELRDTSQLFITQVALNPSGCTDTLTLPVALNCLLNTYFLPNAFTPNGDGLNDLFEPVGIFEGITEYELRVWTRYGERIFITNDINDAWDGTYNGTPSPGGGYLWDVRYINANGERETKKGGVTLLR